MALDRDSTAAKARLHEADLLDAALADAGGTGGFALGDHHLLPVNDITMGVMRERVQDAVSGTLHTTAEAVILTFVVVVAHVSSNWLVDLDFFFLNGYVCLDGTTTFVFDVEGWIDAAAVVSLGDVELRFEGLVVSLAAVVVDFDVVSGVAAVELDVNVGSLVLRRCTVPMWEWGMSVSSGSRASMRPNEVQA